MVESSPIDKLLEFEKQIREAPRRRILEKDNWKGDVPSVGGVYVIWGISTGVPVYVGETCHLNHRFIDLGQKSRHTFRRKAAKILNLSNAKEKALSQAISEGYTLSYLPIPFGRKEVEEFLILRWQKTLINKPPKRLILSNNYPTLRQTS